MSPNLIGALLMMASMAAFTLNDTMLKLTAGAVPLFQLLFVRGLISCALLALVGRRLGPMHFRLDRRDWGLVLSRAGTEVVIAYFFLSALFHMPLANLTAIMQAVPLSVTLASALILREAVGWRRMLAIAVGFCGVMLIVRPGPDGFTVWSLYALLAVLGVTARDLITRKLSPGVPGMTVTFVTAAAVMVAAGLASLTAPWAPLTAGLLGLIASSSVFIIGGYFFSIQVMRTGEVSYVAPFRYTGLIWALLVGWFVFGDWPTTLTLIGAGIVVATGIFSFYRERRVSAG